MLTMQSFFDFILIEWYSIGMMLLITMVILPYFVAKLANKLAYLEQLVEKVEQHHASLEKRLKED